MLTYLPCYLDCAFPGSVKWVKVISETKQKNPQKNPHLLIGVFFLLFLQITAQEPAAQPSEFAPHVTATCKTGTMNIKVKFSSGYTGAVHARDHRTPTCMAMGDGSDAVAFSLNLWAKQGAPDYCGILVSNVSGSNVSTIVP